ncbi:helix-turn-helix domain-containing protein [Streptomyces sp. NPDC087538]|uniref:helix-turn-helix domain-containing protein n=1 Tax=Streptomyces sp. NPDC087538 TaxID=3365797 RepID=UPI003830A911
MARPMNPLPVPGPRDDKLVAFAAGLRALRVKAGNPSLTEMSQRAGISVAVLSNAHGGRKMPTWRTVEGYVRACGADGSGWRPKWEAVQLARQAAHSPDSQAALLKRWASTQRLNPPQWARNGTDLAQALDLLRRFRNLSLRDLARRNPVFSHHTYGLVLRGDRPVTADVLLAVLFSCGVGFGEAQRWMQTLARVRPTEKLRVRSLLLKMPAQTPTRTRENWDRPIPLPLHLSISARG